MLIGASIAATPSPAPSGPAGAKSVPKPVETRPTKDAQGNPLRYAVTGHVSNYDEAKVGRYALPDPLQLASGEPVRDATAWHQRRRPEILAAYEEDIYGRVPPGAPVATWEQVSVEQRALDGAATRKHFVLRLGRGANAATVNVVVVLPVNATGPAPLLLQLVFLNGLTAPRSAAEADRTPANAPRLQETGPVAEFLARGYAYATVRYTEIEGDRAETNLSGVRRLGLAPGQAKPAANEWGTIAAWAWGASRVLDGLATDPAIDSHRVGLIGHSRLGKTVLWAGARDPRFALVFSSCSGEMGAALARRDFGESVDDMALNFPWQFAGNFQKFVGRWNDMPVDAHLLIALLAPRPVFITGGTGDQWADPHGEFLAAVAAGPVYRLLGRKDLGTQTLPPLDTPQIEGDLGFLYHTGGHTIMPGDWKAFLDFADRYLRRTR